MTCAELRARLDDYARGTLTSAEAAAFEDHLTRCAACTAFLEAAEVAPAETAGLPRLVAPAADLWPGIHARIKPAASRVRHRTIPGWLLAAAAVLLVAVSSGVTVLLVRQPSAGVAIQPSGGLGTLEVQYASATAELATVLERARPRLAPATVATIERNLAVIDSALAESRRALAGDPGNATLERLVIGAWRQKMDLLRRATALSSEM
jgi:predicted anti-sigma-YlaC factor YlaD